MKKRRLIFREKSTSEGFAVSLCLILMTLLFPRMLHAQDSVVKGTIVGSDNQPVVGAAVMIEGTTYGTTSDLDGSFMLSLPSDISPEASVVVSCIGYKTGTLPLSRAAGGVLNVELDLDTTMIDEVVVVGDGKV